MPRRGNRKKFDKMLDAFFATFQRASSTDQDRQKQLMRLKETLAKQDENINWSLTTHLKLLFDCIDANCIILSILMVHRFNSFILIFIYYF